MSLFKNKEFKERVIKTIGYVLLFFGVVGLFLPFLQGLLFMALGLYLISLTSPKLREKLMIHFKKQVWFANVLDKIDEIIKKFIEKL